ncbi:MAG: alpha/beta fold hydrolase, partial [Dehalococcoidia bacterium]
MPTASVNGVGLHYEVFGTGRDIVLCHGFSGSHQDWAHPISALMSDYRLVLMDHRGHGSSDAPSSPSAYSMKTFAEDVHSVMTAAGVKRCCLGGHSMGGFIALELTLSHPELVAALVLVDTSSGEMDMPLEHVQARLKALELARTEGMEAA